MGNSNNNKHIAVIVPSVVVHHLDPHTGIPFMPHMAAHLAGAIDHAGYEVQVIDCFGLNPHNRRIEDEFMFLGVDEDWVAHSLHPETQVAFLYCRTVEDLISVERIAKTLQEKRPEITLCAFENIQTVNSFSLKELAPDLLNLGIKVCVLGEPERRAASIIETLLSNEKLGLIKGLVFKQEGKPVFTPPEEFNKDLGELPFPLWEKWPLDGYWEVHFAHGPSQKKRKFIPLLTSRGCPFRCTFCISPSLNPTWRGRPAKNIADEMQYFYEALGIEDFHISDLDPTVKDKHTQEICSELISRKLPVTWKLAQGTKIETIKSERTLELMYEAGCRFISFSPESGSPKMLKIMNKSFKHEYALKMVSKMNDLGIRTQACFVAGVPGEEEEDRKISISYVKELVKAGVDEIAVTIFTPLPGAELSGAITGYDHYSQLTHSPTWRADYSEINRFRFKMYITFFIHKALWPRKVIREIIGFLTKNFETKMEMSLYKQVKLYLLYFAPALFKKLDAEKIQQKVDQVKRLKAFEPKLVEPSKQQPTSVNVNL